MEHPSFFGGDASDLGHVRRLAPTSFRELVDQVLNLAVTLNVTRAEYAALDPKARQKAKRVPYVVPCTFASSPSQRLHEKAQDITIICLDIDDPKLAAPYYAGPETIAEQLMPFNFAMHTTASSTPKAPRLRILVEAGHLPVSRYSEAINDVAKRIGLVKVNKESYIAVQPMYLPTIFKGETQHPLLVSETSGRAYTEKDIEASGDDLSSTDGVDSGKPAKGAGADATGVDDLDFLRPVVEEITIQDAAGALKHLDPDCTYPEWLEVAASLRHQFSKGAHAEAAYHLFDEWSSAGTKYVGSEDTMAKWSSLRPNPRGRTPVTIRTLMSRATAAGWDANPTKAKCYATTLAWIKGQNRDEVDATQLITEGLKRIAATPLLTVSEEEALMQEIVAAARRSRQAMKVGVPVLRKDLRRLKAAAADQKAKKAKLPEWCKGMTYVSKINEFLRPSTSEQFSPEALDRVFGSKLLPTEEQLKEGGDQSMSTRGRPVLRPQDYLLNIVGIPTAYDLLYDPQQCNDIFIHNEGKTYVNTYVRNYPEPDPLQADAAGVILKEHLGNLIAEPEYRAVILDYMAYIVQNPGIKIRWAILLQGAEGCGKTYLAEAMSVVLGAGHVKPVDSEAVKSQWNDWAYGNQLVAVEEIRIAGQNRHEIMNRLKPLITNDTICISQRFRDARNVANRSNYMLFTNHHDALALNDTSRRYFVVKSAIQTKKQIDALGGEKYFDKIFSMLRDNPSGLRAFLELHEISPSFKPDGRAPSTTYLTQLISDAATDVTAAVRDIVEDSLQPLVREDLLSSSTLLQMLEGQGLNKISGQHLASVLREDGWVRVGRWTLIDGQKHPMWIKADSALSAAHAQLLANKRIAESEQGESLEAML